MTAYEFKGRYPAKIKSVLVCLTLAIRPVTVLSADNQPAPLNYFLYSYGPASMPTMHLGWVFIAIALAVLIIIASLLAGAIFRKRAAADRRALGREDQGMPWIYIGTGISTCILFAMAVYSFLTLNAVARPQNAPSLTVTVTAYDWWWKVEYEDPDPARRFVTANEIHIPVGEPVLVKLKSADVIHAFWVPTLAGKTQMVPGLTNQQWIQADAEGIYRGQCTQYCGLQHAHMGFEIVAQSAAGFRKWQGAQRQTAVTLAGADANAGKQLFLERCAGCHTIRGTEAAGNHAPDLTHLQSRRLIAGGLLTNTPEHLLQWITHAQQLKPGARMPSMELTTAEMAAVSAFLSTLQ